MKSKLFNVLKILISVGMLAYVLLTLNWDNLAQVVSEVRWGYIGVAVVLAFAGVALRAVRWQALLKGLAIDVPLGRLVKLYFVGTFFNCFLPTGFGGDAIRVVELARGSHKAPEAAGTVLVDRATGLWVMFVMGLVALPFGAGDIPQGMVWLVTAVALAVVIGGWVVMGTRFIPWLGSKVKLPGQAKLERFYRALSGCGYVALAQACAISLIFNLMVIVVNFMIALGLNVDLPLGTFFIFSPLLAMALLIPSVGGLGVGEAVYQLVYGTLDVSKEFSTTMSLTRYMIQSVLPGIVGGILYAIDGALGLRTDPDKNLEVID